ncbi:MAG: hypothetical protein R6W90_13280 [Ignavibacteriaceae bacterium]
MRRISDYSFILTFIWLGFILAISFLEAPVKFTTPSLTLAVGLDVGRNVFSALNKVELSFAIVTIILSLFSRLQIKILVFLSLIAVILIAQTFWLLPELSLRVDYYLNGQTPPPSNSHIFYIIAEAIKVILLFLLGWFQIKNITTNYFLNISRDKTFTPGL